MADNNHMKRNLLVFLPFHGGADVNGDIGGFHICDFPVHIAGNHRQTAADRLRDLLIFLQNLLNHFPFRIDGGRSGEHGGEMVRQVFKEFIVVVQVDFQFLRNRRNELARNHLYLDRVLIGGFLADIPGLLQQGTETGDVVFRGPHAAVLRDVAQNVLGHEIALAVVHIGLGLHELPLQVPVNHDAEIEEDVLKGGVREERIMQMFLLVENLLNHHPVPRLHIGHPGHGLFGLHKTAAQRPHQKEPLFTLFPHHAQSLVGAGCQFQIPGLQYIADAVQVLDDGGAADKQAVRNLSHRDIRGRIDQNDRRHLGPFFRGEFVGIKTVRHHRQKDLSEILRQDNLAAALERQPWIIVLFQQVTDFIQIVSDCPLRHIKRGRKFRNGDRGFALAQGPRNLNTPLFHELISITRTTLLNFRTAIIS